MELLSLIVVMSEGLGFNLCVAPFLNICVPNLPKGQGQRLSRGCQSLVRGAVLEMGEKKLSQRGSESEDRCR